MPSVAAVDVWEQAARDADFKLKLPGGTSMFFRRIPAGSFRMGSRGFAAEAEPVHRVTITRDFFLGTFALTQEQYRAVARRCPALKDNARPSRFKGQRRPVENVSWHDATAFCAWLSAWEKLPTAITEVRLPTEAQWEYACPGGTDTDYYSGDGEVALAEVAWYGANSGGETRRVDERPETHPFGLHGMHGNVFEWCRDAWDAGAYRKRIDGAEDPEVSPAGDDQARVLRGGSWDDTAGGCRSAGRSWGRPGGRFVDFGFRVCLVPGPVERRGASRK
jgi:formylglycine-generating enzyme required for sulfatase activity